MATRQEIEKLLGDLQYHTIEQVLNVVKSGEGSSQDIRNALTILKDNGFTMRDAPPDKDPQEFLEDLNKEMPQLPTINEHGEIIEADIE